ncbi:MAG: hypothetical protein SCARUB_03414 [Candidatus Scalindua rubra]|uniref:Uncharacterized protein n=1 Tax=Candidatus Scalindua rubra TaxID=1872076 RepID=A0A1E3X745_9BACT|nr:MAG: hypothetical protein SCARUB_03414 [Candidatus Scalindua rubra]
MIEFSTKLRIFIIPLACSILIGWIDPASDKNEEGVQLYNEEKYDEAIGKFTDAQLYLPESDSLDFNIANTHYKEGKFPEAEKSFENILNTKDTTLKAKTTYNMGNTLYKQGKFNEALNSYKQAIELTENKNAIKSDELKGIREDAKYNYEFVQKKIEEMKKEQQERQEQEKQDKQKKQEEQEKQKQEQQQQQQSEKDDTKQQEQQKQQEKQDKRDKKEESKPEKKSSPEKKMKESPPQPYEKKEMTKEEAERILDALKQAERAARDVHEKEDKSAQFNIEKNW